MTVKLEVFTGEPPCPSCLETIDLCLSVAEEYKGEIELIRYSGEAGLERFNEYHLVCVPAVVINGMVKIEGVTPSRYTLLSALGVGGLCLK
ncbi:Thioredoxin domain-containing protein [Desulfofundulus australicus DSM 11792]|uniref:Thioredoxin domain-containing protein n=1 Tax=Desulfofundulus australicus DSM 11792 TaxID=1121425 RepID=A0A1M4ZAP7_9FIRM|nr:thioredoxin family protein [Desulfofundulus australicus]SHF15055.1 Thioredoxin domain-containing protein [Desulfofundulus australicus DSM 11792]